MQSKLNFYLPIISLITILLLCLYFLSNRSTNNTIDTIHYTDISTVQLVNKLNIKTYSPLSILYALSLVDLFTFGKAKEELHNLANMYEEPQLKQIYKLFNNSTVSLTNMFIFNKKFNVDKNLLTNIHNIVYILYEDFSNTQYIVDKTNKYIEDKTHGMIKNCISTSAIQQTTPFIIVNTLYFKSKWLHPFAKHNTKQSNFISHSNKNKVVDMMHQTHKFKYYEDSDNCQYLELPYVDNTYSMYIILPKLGVLPKFTDIDSSKYVLTDIDLYLPKFTSSESIDFVSVLKAADVNSIFSKPGIYLGSYVYITNIIHKVMVIVDEQGVEASAATIVFTKESVSYHEPKKILFKADHEFIYVIKHNLSNTILFYGHYN